MREHQAPHVTGPSSGLPGRGWRCHPSDSLLLLPLLLLVFCLLPLTHGLWPALGPFKPPATPTADEPEVEEHAAGQCLSGSDPQQTSEAYAPPKADPAQARAFAPGGRPGCPEKHAPLSFPLPVRSPPSV